MTSDDLEEIFAGNIVREVPIVSPFFASEMVAIKHHSDLGFVIIPICAKFTIFYLQFSNCCEFDVAMVDQEPSACRVVFHRKTRQRLQPNTRLINHDACRIVKPLTFFDTIY